MLRLVRPAGAPLGLLLWFFLFIFALYVRRPRRAVGTCFQANSSFRVPSGQSPFFSPGWPVERPMGAPARRTRWVFCWGYLSLSWAAARAADALRHGASLC